MRKPFISGNWKMNMTHKKAVSFMQDLGYKYKNKNNCEVAVFPPFTALRSVKTIIDSDNLNIGLGAQNMHYESKGAFTGEISPEMLKTLGVEYVIIGHSERRQYFSETDELVNKKIFSALKEGIKPIICIGETLDIRESGKADEYVIGQLKKGLEGVDNEDIGKITIAYEPIWAIGTGKTATSEDANSMCLSIRKNIEKLYNKRISENCRILYGGSVKPSNVTELMGMSDIDGALVGGASIKADDFMEIINY
ncbi:MAG: triose-phosphate isomerase [Actinomycetota bacterium]|nr:triose-phosphate isomerase [Actinomycetota bacterium]